VSAVARARFALRSLSLNVEVDGGSPPLLLDRKWVARAIHNYLDNAMKYTPDGAQIRLRAFTREATLHIEVADDGAGLPPEVQAHLFERFYRANASGNIPGMGLGLAMVRSIAEAHGGAVYVASTPGAGSTFGISLPIRPASAEAV
jgi:signal transduction histidine kinase